MRAGRPGIRCSAAVIGEATMLVQAALAKPVESRLMYRALAGLVWSQAYGPAAVTRPAELTTTMSRLDRWVHLLPLSHDRRDS